MDRGIVDKLADDLSQIGVNACAPVLLQAAPSVGAVREDVALGRLVEPLGDAVVGSLDDQADRPELADVVSAESEARVDVSSPDG